MADTMIQPDSSSANMTSCVEDNLKQGRFANFQFPHPEHADEAHDSMVYFLQSSGNYLVSCSKDTTIRIWNISTQRLALPPLLGHTASVLCAQVDEQADVLISAGVDAQVIVWQFSTGKILNRIDSAHPESILALRFNADILATASKDRSVKLWDRKTLRHTLTLTGHSAAVNALRLTDRHVVSGSGDRLIKIWDVATGECVRTIRGHQKGIACLALAADGVNIISGGSDTTVRICDWDGAELAVLRGHSNLVRSVSIGDAGAAVQAPPPATADGEDAQASSRVDRIVSGSYDGSVVIWTREPDSGWTVTRRLDRQDTCRKLLAQTAGGADIEDGEPEVPWRVMNVQFDGRRLICCGGGKEMIVGWDFGLPQTP